MSLPGLRPCLAILSLLVGTLSVAAALADEAKVVVASAHQGEAFTVDITIEVPVSVATAWDVLTDFDHMADFLSNLRSSKVSRRDANTWLVAQTGVVRWGLLSFSFDSERELRLEPMRRIVARSLSGSLRRMESESSISPNDHGVRIRYHAELWPDSFLARLFGAPFIRHEVGEQFQAMEREMLRRQRI